MTSSHSKYYGPFRESTKIANAHKEIATRDCVQEALSYDQHGGDKDKVWLTSTKDSFQATQVGKQINTKKVTFDSQLTLSPDVNNRLLGFDGTRYLTTNQDYKAHSNSYRTPSRHKTENRTHIPDFCSDYIERTEEQNSEYQSSYDTLLPRLSSPNKSSEERRKHTNDLRATHFQLGDSLDGVSTETQHSFNTQPFPSGNQNIRKSKTLEASRSRVFRSGDWNEVNGGILQSGLTKSDFPTHSSSLYEECRKHACDKEKKYHRSTHFTFDFMDAGIRSAYQKDYIVSRPCMKFLRPPIAAPLPTAKFFANDGIDQSSTFKTTNRESFNIKTDGQRKSISGGTGRLLGFKNVKKRHAESSVPFVLKSETFPKQVSVTSSDFYKKIDICKKENEGLRSFISKYDHVTHHQNEKLCSEARENYKALNHNSLTARLECQNKRRDNKSTHFELGNDPSQRIKHTEHSSQFQSNLSTSLSSHAAGESLPKAYSYTFPSFSTNLNTKNGVNGGQFPISVMKEHYKDYGNAGIQSRSQRNICDSIETHFFHLENQCSGTQKSTTGIDFISPATPLLASV